MAALRSPSALPPQVTPPALALCDAMPAAVPAEVVALPVLPAEGTEGALTLGPGAADFAETHDLLGVLEFERATGSAGEVVSYVVPDGDGPRRILLIGVGEQRSVDFRRAGAALARAVRDVETVVTTIPALDPAAAIEPFVAGAVLGSFGFSWRAAGPEWRPAASITLAEVPSSFEPDLARAVVIAHAGWRARLLSTVPSNLKNPAWLADRAVELAEEHDLAVKVWDERQLAAEGFGGIVGVGQASATPPRLIRLDYTPSKANRLRSKGALPTIVLVGKGITFDSGGLSIKPAEPMATMKRDMTGGAVVMATMAALDEVGCPVKVVGLIATAENAVSGSALRPGDVVRHYGGRTSEVNNTDAEGRLVMADALAYGVDQLAPAALVDVATLTGAIKVALGQQVGGYFANNDALASSIERAADVSGEAMWRMPLASVYEDKLSSTIADADNAPGGPGAITAALFLQHFVGGLPWLHLDIASVGDTPSDTFEWTAGPSGFGARLLLTWLGQPDPLAGVGA